MNLMNNKNAYMFPAAVLLAATVFVGGLSAGADPSPAAVALKWEYNTTQISLDQLTSTLKQMGDDGWEVFSIQDTSSIVESDPATNVPHVKTEMFQVTAKRLAP